MNMAAQRRTRKVKTSKKTYMSNESFVDLKKALERALAYECGKRRDLPVTRIDPNVAQKAKTS
jgi:hypothetical protein